MIRDEAYLAGAGTMLLVWASRDLVRLFIRDLSDPVVAAFGLGTWQTHFSELFLETDYVGAGDTLLAWIGVGMIAIAVLSVVVRYHQRRQRDDLEHGGEPADV